MSNVQKDERTATQQLMPVEQKPVTKNAGTQRLVY